MPEKNLIWLFRVNLFINFRNNPLFEKYYAKGSERKKNRLGSKLKFALLLLTASLVFILILKSTTLDVTKTVLNNGLTILLLEKHDVPIVTSTIWYKVGSVNENKGQTGISHFLEHLMFKGTPNYAKGEIDFLTSTSGGHNNAGTIFDYTMYYFNFSSDRWELALEIESDRMQHCLFDPDEFEAERKVVLEELKRQQDAPWGELAIQLEATMFQVHPYHHPVIGWQEDLEHLSIETVINYYNTYYVPNNATIVIAGDIDSAVAVEKVQQYFAHIPANTELPAFQSCEPKQQGERRFKIYQESNLKRLEIGYHAPTLADKDNYVLDMIDYLLSHGKTARLYQRLVEEEQLVTFVDTCYHHRRFHGVFHLFTALRPGVSPERVEKVLDEEFARLRTDEVLPEEFQKAKNAMTADFIFEKATTSGLAHALGEYEMLYSYEYINTYMEHIERIIPKDIMHVTQTYLVENNRTVGWSLPRDPNQERKAFVSEVSSPPPSTDMVFHKPPVSGVQNLFCLAAQPPSPTHEIFSLDNHWFRHHRWVLENGLTVLFLENHVLPVISFEAFVDAGQKYETDEKAGVAVLTGQLLDEGTAGRSGYDIAQAIESVGGILEAQSRGVSAQVLSKDLTLAMDLISDVLTHPTFEQEKLDKKRYRILASLDGDEDNLSLVAYNLFREMVYGPHPYHRPRKGYKKTLQHLTRDDLVNFYTTYFRPNNTILAIVGDAEPDEVFQQVQQFFGEWAYRDLPSQLTFTIPRPEGCVRKHIDRAREQNHLYLGHLGITRTNPDFYILFTMDHILGIGPGFTDRISRKLRDEQGLAYSVSASISISADKDPGVFAAYIATSPSNTNRAIEGFLEEIRRIRTEPVLQEELDLAKNYITGSYVFNFETSNQLAHYLVNVERYQLGEDFIWKFPQLIEQITVEDIQRAVRQYLDPENYYIASVGKLTE